MIKERDSFSAQARGRGISTMVSPRGIIICVVAAIAVVLGGAGTALSEGSHPGEQSYQDARQLFYRVLRSPDLRQDPKNWEKVIEGYENVVVSYPESHRVPYSLYMAARCAARLYEDFHDPGFLNQAIMFFSQLSREFPEHHLADDALFYIGEYSKELGRPEEAATAFLTVMEHYPLADCYERAREQYQRLPKTLTKNKDNSEETLLASSALPLSSTFQQKLSVVARERFNHLTTIVIDPGHGGRDPGAMSSGGLAEKDVVLAIGRLLARKLTKLPNVKVVMTRALDRFLTLEGRTAVANNHGADLFVSIHLNAIADPSFCGAETYFLNLTNDPRSLAVAAKENATSDKKMSDLQMILMDLLADAKINESSLLAETVQNELYTLLRRRVPGVRNLGVKQAPFCVLFGAQMPSILVEAAFISNPMEERRLKSPDYLNLLADGIYRGITRYQKQTKVAHR